MKTALRLILLLVLSFALSLSQLSPARADDETPPANEAADIITLYRLFDQYPGSLGSQPSDLAVYGGFLFYSADANNGIGRELWVYNSTLPLGPANPSAFDVCPGTGYSFPAWMTVYKGVLYFNANGCDGAGFELWKFTMASGLQRVTDILPDGAGSNPGALAVMGTRLYFHAFTNDGLGRELWAYDSSLPVSATNPESFDICPGAGSSHPDHLAAYDGALYFQADGCDGSGYELWKFTPELGAQRAADIAPGNASSSPSYLQSYNGGLYFGANGMDGAGFELWMYDAEFGAQRVANIAADSTNSGPAFLTVYNGALYFSAYSVDNAGVELWKYDPVKGADQVADIAPGAVASSPSSLAVYNGALYFNANGFDGLGSELWLYDNSTTAAFRPARSHDGWVLEFSEIIGVGGTLNNKAATFNLGDDAQDRQYLSILSFNTSTLPDNAVITSATLKIRRQGLTGQNPFATHGNILVDIIKGAFSGSNTLQVTDFQAVPSRAAVATIKNLPDINNWFTGKLLKTAFPSINKIGVTQLRLRFAKDDNDDLGADFLRFFSADTTSLGDFPVLEVKYYIP